MQNQPDWKNIITRARAGENAAISLLIDQTQKNLFQFCYHLVRNKQLAEDILHDTYLKALSNLHQLKNEEAILGWLKQIARSQFLDLVKSSAYKNEIFTESWSEIDHRSVGFDQNVQMDVMKILSQMSEEDRLILVLIDIQESSYEEASIVLNLAEGTVKSRLFRAREKFSILFEGTKKQVRSSELSKGVKS